MNALRALAVASMALVPALLSATDRKEPVVEHAVIVHFQYGSTNLDKLFEAERRLEAAIDAAKAGELDGNEVAADGSDGFLYLYGPDADKLLQAIEPVLKSIPFMDGAKVTRRYGPPGDGVKKTVTTVAR